MGKSIAPAAEYIDFDRQTRSFSFNSEKMEKNKSIAAFEEDGLGWSVFKRILMIIVITGLDCLWLYFTAYPLLIFFIENMPFKQFSIFIFFFGYLIPIIFFIFLVVIGMFGFVFNGMIIFSLFQNLANVMKLKKVERNVFSNAKYYLTE